MRAQDQAMFIIKYMMLLSFEDAFCILVLHSLKQLIKARLDKDYIIGTVVCSAKAETD